MSFDIDVRLRRGERLIETRFNTGPGITALYGPSGSGKTTILHMIAGLLTPDAGRIIVANKILYDFNIKLPPEKRRCGLIFQDKRLFPHLSVAENLRYGERRASPEHRWISFAETIDFLGIAHLLARYPRNLSGGEAQRVAIGRALLAAPRFLAMDEPLTALDPPRREEILQVIERIRDTLKIPILYVSHDRTEVERLADNITAINIV